jgi:hypothetical protein
MYTSQEETWEPSRWIAGRLRWESLLDEIREGSGQESVRSLDRVSVRSKEALRERSKVSRPAGLPVPRPAA